MSEEAFTYLLDLYNLTVIFLILGGVAVIITIPKPGGKKKKDKNKKKNISKYQAYVVLH